jgi:hypothetical protein
MPTEEQSSTRSHQGVPQGGGIELSLDELAKGLATGNLSRGKAIRWMGGALLGAALASIPGVAWADDDCRRLGRGCRRDSQCCSKNCIRQGDEKVCGCPEGKTACNERCVNLDRNDNHCGECFNRCDEEVECIEGVCGGTECTEHIICLVVEPTCGPGTEPCFCAESVEGTLICGADPCGEPCSTDAECDAIVPGAVCQIPEGGCCGQTCIFPCGAAPLTVSSPSTNSGG